MTWLILNGVFYPNSATFAYLFSEFQMSAPQDLSLLTFFKWQVEVEERSSRCCLPLEWRGLWAVSFLSGVPDTWGAWFHPWTHWIGVCLVLNNSVLSFSGMFCWYPWPISAVVAFALNYNSLFCTLQPFPPNHRLLPVTGLLILSVFLLDPWKSWVSGMLCLCSFIQQPPLYLLPCRRHDGCGKDSHLLGETMWDSHLS